MRVVTLDYVVGAYMNRFLTLVILLYVSLIFSTLSEENNNGSAMVFCLKSAKGEILGPFENRAGASLGGGSIVVHDSISFSLHYAKNNKKYGPFVLTDGDEIQIGNSCFTIITEFAGVRGEVDHTDLVPEKSPVHMVHLNADARGDLEAMKADYVSLSQRYQDDVKPYLTRREMVNCIGVHHTLTDVVTQSDHNKDSKIKKYVAKAESELDQFLAKHPGKTLYPGDGGSFECSTLEPGAYAVFCVGTVKNPEKRPMFLPALWWTEKMLEKGSDVSVKFNELNKRDILQLFVQEVETKPEPQEAVK